MTKVPKIGVGVIVRKNGKVLFGKRKNAHNAGYWGSPGGQLAFGETWEECARREVREETGVEITNVHLGMVTNDIFKKDGEHFITICMIADYASGTVKIMEPDKCEKLEWFKWDNLPQPLMLPEINRIKLGFNPFKST